MLYRFGKLTFLPDLVHIHRSSVVFGRGILLEMVFAWGMLFICLSCMFTYVSDCLLIVYSTIYASFRR